MLSDLVPSSAMSESEKTPPGAWIWKGLAVLVVVLVVGLFVLLLAGALFGYVMNRALE